MEETGYTVISVRFAALCEEICMHEGFRKMFPDYAHKMYHIFICKLANKDKKVPVETDEMQIACEWIDINSLKNIRILPEFLGKSIYEVINKTAPIFLGSEHIDFNHG